MKKSRNSQKHLMELYEYFDNRHYGPSNNLTIEEVQRDLYLNNKYGKKYSDIYNTLEYYGIFKNKKGQYGIDPKRYSKKLGDDLSKFKFMNKRHSTFYYPNKKTRDSYFINILVDGIESLKAEFVSYKNNILTPVLSSIKAKKFTPGDMEGLQMGILDYDEACQQADVKSILSKIKAKEKFEEEYYSLYSQFFHIMVSKIEKLSFDAFKLYNPKIYKFNRNQFYDNINKSKISNKDLPSYKYHNEMYLIWNLIKHNNNDVFEKLKNTYPDVLRKTDYDSRYLGYRYIDFNDELINNLLDGVENFFKEWSINNLDEDYSRTNYDYLDYYLKKVTEEINFYNYPFGY